MGLGVRGEGRGGRGRCFIGSIGRLGRVQSPGGGGELDWIKEGKGLDFMCVQRLVLGSGLYNWLVYNFLARDHGR